ncbi:MAG: malonate decarboxylase holo-[acyl-carrier-protein] synthase [Betaproteobacteria bacterium]|nr:malonate decarboxylase holo-[acyl-carrier-protein] synthase [Betaproteobacteria bacterium]
MLPVPLQRHDLVFLTSLTSDCHVTPAHQRDWIESWQQSGRAFWVTRQSSSEYCSVGITRYTEQSKERISVKLPWQRLKCYQAPPLLSDLIPLSPATWQPLLHLIIQLAEQHGVVVRVYGALVSEIWLGGGQLRPESDVDVLLIPTNPSALHAFLLNLQALTQNYPSPRIDGEIRCLNEDVAWREYLHNLDQPCLVKSMQSVKLVNQSTLLTTLRKERLRLASVATEALYHELMLYPKPGLVSPLDRGSHTDMDAPLLWRSIMNLRHYFLKLVDLGQQQASFTSLREAGIEAERQMLELTQGVNTYRGAIFHMGLLLAARASQPVTTAHNICSRILNLWGEALLAHQKLTRQQPSHGQIVYQRWHRPGALEMALSGYRFIVEEALPFYRAKKATQPLFYARSTTLLFLMAHVEDSTILWRGGERALDEVQQEARQLLSMGELSDPRCWARWLSFHYRLVHRHLSPGGSADLLSFTLALDQYALEA